MVKQARALLVLAEDLGALSASAWWLLVIHWCICGIYTYMKKKKTNHTHKKSKKVVLKIVTMAS